MYYLVFLLLFSLPGVATIIAAGIASSRPGLKRCAIRVAIANGLSYLGPFVLSFFVPNTRVFLDFAAWTVILVPWITFLPLLVRYSKSTH
jgi:hypothetical protein